MKPWCIERDGVSADELNQLQEVAEYFGSENDAGVEFVTVMYDFCGVDSDVNTANETKWFNNNLITYNEAIELMTGLKTRDVISNSGSITTKTYKGKTYEIGKLYQFSDYEDDYSVGARLVDINHGSKFPFENSNKASFRYCREINPDSLGKITKPKIEPEIGKVYKVKLGSYPARYIEWRENTALLEAEEIICEMVEKV